MRAVERQVQELHDQRLRRSAPLETEEPSDPQLFIDLMSLELKRLADAQMGYHDMHRDYADDLKSLKFAPRSKVQIRVGSADPFGFWARATHELLPDRACNIFVGKPPGAPQLKGSEGQPTCSQS